MRQANNWVTCESNDERVRAYFWTEGEWENRRTEDLDPNDLANAAERIWNFIVPGVDTASTHSM
jgi:hypothetical protein